MFESVRVNRALEKMHFPSFLLLAPAFSHDNYCLGYLYGCVCVCVHVNIDSLSVFGFCHPVKHSVDTGMNSFKNKSLSSFLTVQLRISVKMIRFKETIKSYI